MEIGQQTEFQEQDQSQSTQSSPSEIGIFPYVPLGDAWTFSEEFLGAVFDKIVEQKLLKTTFWEGSITNAVEFVSMVKSPNNHVVFFLEGDDCLGLAWLSAVTSNYAFAHFCSFREIYGRSVKLGKDCVDYWFSWPGDGGPLLDVIVGIMPGINKTAHKYVEKLGWIRLGIIPGMFRDKERNQEDAVIYYTSR